MKLVKYFLQKKAVTILLLVLILAGGLFSYIKMGKLEDAPFTIKQALVLTPYPGASPSEVQSQVTDVLEESIQSLGELYYLKTENRTGLSKITVYVKKEIRADEMQQLWDKLRRKVNDVQSKLPAGAGRRRRKLRRNVCFLRMRPRSGCLFGQRERYRRFLRRQI